MPADAPLMRSSVTFGENFVALFLTLNSCMMKLKVGNFAPIF